MLDRERVYKILSKWVDTPESITDQIMKESLSVGDTVYVVTRYSKIQPYEVIKGVVTTTRYQLNNDRKNFSVTGKYANNNWYNGTFSWVSSFGKSVFKDYSEATQVCETKNNRRNSNG